MAFDTLEFARRLKGAGFTDQQAEVLAEATRDRRRYPVSQRPSVDRIARQIGPFRTRFT